MSSKPIVGQKGVKYGLQVRKPAAPAPAGAPKPPAIFGGDSDSDEDTVGAQVQRQAYAKKADTKVRRPPSVAATPLQRAHALWGSLQRRSRFSRHRNVSDSPSDREGAPPQGSRASPALPPAAARGAPPTPPRRPPPPCRPRLKRLNI
jgi:hypothetical protein